MRSKVNMTSKVDMTNNESIVRKHIPGIINYEENENQITVSTKNIWARMENLNVLKELLGAKEINVCLPWDKNIEVTLIYEIVMK